MGPSGGCSLQVAASEAAGRRRCNRKLPESPRPAGPGARLRMPRAPSAHTFPKSTPGFGSNRGGGGGGGRADVAGGAGREIESWEAGLGVSEGSEDLKDQCGIQSR